MPDRASPAPAARAATPSSPHAATAPAQSHTARASVIASYLKQADSYMKDADDELQRAVDANLRLNERLKKAQRGTAAVFNDDLYLRGFLLCKWRAWASITRARREKKKAAAGVRCCGLHVVQVGSTSS